MTRRNSLYNNVSIIRVHCTLFQEEIIINQQNPIQRFIKLYISYANQFDTSELWKAETSSEDSTKVPIPSLIPKPPPSSLYRRRPFHPLYQKCWLFTCIINILSSDYIPFPGNFLESEEDYGSSSRPGKFLFLIIPFLFSILKRLQNARFQGKFLWSLEYQSFWPIYIGIATQCS